MQGLTILFAIFYILLFYFHSQAAKEAAKNKLKETKFRDNSIYNKAPQNIAALITLLILFSFFDLFSYKPQLEENSLFVIKASGLFFYAFFSFLQIPCIKKIGKYYSVEIQVFKDHKLISDGIYSKVRHPQYLFQILSDIGAGVFFMSYVILPIALFIEIPVLIKRIKIEEEYLKKFFGDEYENYKKTTGIFFPKLAYLFKSNKNI